MAGTQFPMKVLLVREQMRTEKQVNITYEDLTMHHAKKCEF